jgi:hypothetical protein
MGKSFGDSARGAGKESRSSWGTVSGGGSPGKHRGKPAKGKGGVGKPAKGSRGKNDWWTGKPVQEKKSGWW